LASGTAVVSTPNPGSVEILSNGDAGLIVPLESLGYAIVGLLQDQSRRRIFELAGLSRSRSFDWEACAVAHEQVYKSLGHRGDS
jgi:glycosyltransferase involved in cell wall biosynthesis